MYIYRTKILTTSDVSDFETNYRASAIVCTGVLINTMAFEIDVPYADFKNLVDGVTVTWGDVRYVHYADSRYYLLFGTENPIE
jgi:hypothetical protein